MDLSLVRPIIFVMIVLFLSSCFTQVSPPTSEPRQAPYPPMPDRLTQLIPEYSDRLHLGVEKVKSMKDIAERLEWEGFSICYINEEIQTLAAQQRFRNERFTLQMNLIKMGNTLEAVIIWSHPRSIPHPMSSRRAKPRQWNIAYINNILSSKTSTAFALGTYHLLYIPHHSLEFKSGYHFNSETTGFCN